MQSGAMARTENEYPIRVRKLTKEEGGGYLAEFPDLPGCMADGDTPAEALKKSEDPSVHGLERMPLALLKFRFGIRSILKEAARKPPRGQE